MGNETANPIASGRAWQKLMEMHKKISLDAAGYIVQPPEKSEEELLREKYPAAQDAWEKYQAILTLCRTSDE